MSPADLGSRIAALIQVWGAGAGTKLDRVKRSETTTGSELLTITVDGVAYNVTITKARKR